MEGKGEGMERWVRWRGMWSEEGRGDGEVRGGGGVT